MIAGSCTGEMSPSTPTMRVPYGASIGEPSGIPPGASGDASPGGSAASAASGGVNERWLHAAQANTTSPQTAIRDGALKVFDMACLDSAERAITIVVATGS